MATQSDLPRVESPHMHLQITPATIEDKPTLANLLELYIYEFSELDGADVGENGRYGYPPLNRYWIESSRLAFLVRAEGKLAGFALLRQGTYFPEQSAEPGMLVAEFFVLRKYRRQGIGRQVTRALFDRYPGRWEVAELPQNAAGQASSRPARRNLPVWNRSADPPGWRRPGADRGAQPGHAKLKA